jgi:hypothetical protein
MLKPFMYQGNGDLHFSLDSKHSLCNSLKNHEIHVHNSIDSQHYIIFGCWFSKLSRFKLTLKMIFDLSIKIQFA